ncbi:b3 domain-containing protein rem16 [Quercus suber]|uniref:B3 domain-containing protein rem16 n=1 Tax=Quercus suber TaxID=58331 RepID=A0AAW0JG15_QUESU
MRLHNTNEMNRCSVEMGDACKDYSKWAEDIYWTHFQTFHFYQFLLSGFDRQLFNTATKWRKV